MASEKPISKLGVALTDYRKMLVEAEQKAQESFDKTVLSLSGGALGISFIFLKDVIGSAVVQKPAVLLLAWCSWGLSSFAVLLSFFLSQIALRRAIDQVDDGTIYGGKPGGRYATATAALNFSGPVLFVFGVALIIIFAQANLANRGETNGEATNSTTEAAEVAATATATAADSEGR